MKPFILSLILILGLTATNHGKPITTIYSIQEPVISEEAYVNDIPFNTWEIAVEAILDGDELKLEDEPNVDDIPFNTRAIACKHILSNMIESSGEINIDDIPFDTERIYCEHMASLLTEEYRNEKMVQDLPQSSGYIICIYDKGDPSCSTFYLKATQWGNFGYRKLMGSDFTIILPVKINSYDLEIDYDDFDQQVILTPGFSL